MHGTMHPIHRRTLTVLEVETLSPSMRRITLGGDGLEADFPFVPLAVSDHVKVVFPGSDGSLALPDPEKGMRLREPVDGHVPIIREYTIRGYNAELRGIVLDFVLHEHGVAGRWATNAAVGDALGILGPRGSRIFPTDPSTYLIAVDETAFPAAERFIEELPQNILLRIYAVAPERNRRPLGRQPRGEVEWVNSADDLVARVTQDLLAAPLPDDAVVWGAGEQGAMQQLRRALSDGSFLPKSRIDLHGYWRIGFSGEIPHE